MRRRAARRRERVRIRGCRFQTRAARAQPPRCHIEHHGQTRRERRASRRVDRRHRERDRRARRTACAHQGAHESGHGGHQGRTSRRTLTRLPLSRHSTSPHGAEPDGFRRSSRHASRDASGFSRRRLRHCVLGAAGAVREASARRGRRSARHAAAVHRPRLGRGDDANRRAERALWQQADHRGERHRARDRSAAADDRGHAACARHHAAGVRRGARFARRRHERACRRGRACGATSADVGLSCAVQRGRLRGIDVHDLPAFDAGGRARKHAAVLGADAGGDARGASASAAREAGGRRSVVRHAARHRAADRGAHGHHVSRRRRVARLERAAHHGQGARERRAGRPRLHAVRDRDDGGPPDRRRRDRAHRRPRDADLGRRGGGGGVRGRAAVAARDAGAGGLSADRPWRGEHRAGAVPARGFATGDARRHGDRRDHDDGLCGDSGRPGWGGLRREGGGAGDGVLGAAGVAVHRAVLRDAGDGERETVIRISIQATKKNGAAPPGQAPQTRIQHWRKSPR
ncbi:putative Co/Zn/Cd efflux system membrane fusion protein [Paraburkholderia tropica]